jgi:hypothetical protein
MWQWAQYALDNLEDIAQALAEPELQHERDTLSCLGPPGLLAANATTLIQAPKVAGSSKQRQLTWKNCHCKQVTSLPIPNSYTQPCEPNNEDDEDHNNNDKLKYAGCGLEMDKDTTIFCLSSSDLFASDLFIYNGPNNVANNKEEMAAIHHFSHYKPAKKHVLARFIAGHSDWGKHPWTDMQEFHKAVCISHCVFFEAANLWLTFLPVLDHDITHCISMVSLLSKQQLWQVVSYILLFKLYYSNGNNNTEIHSLAHCIQPYRKPAETMPK